MLTPTADSSSLEVLGFSPQPLTLEQIKYSGILESIPKKPSTQAGAPVINIGDISDSCEICKALIDIGYDIRLGEAGRLIILWRDFPHYEFNSHVPSLFSREIP
eukprot:Gregarina_sp_Poly_1__3728@NODE_2100_length_2685_cov_249_111154_g1240_i1_p3_GENE_NODE_2100_length_2685_cov_249_111154_g1240_i1NODE_2100_length_2685_cov_249_111154_g1240_i1_p3_ORF_typecomplete_len104_score16_72_NODE_2100_length_2685_cov_249_111154_g1240_i113211632